MLLPLIAASPASAAAPCSLVCQDQLVAPVNHGLLWVVVLGGPAQAAQRGAAAPSLTPCFKLVSSSQLIYYLEIHFPLAAEALTSKQLAEVMNFSAAALRELLTPSPPHEVTADGG